MLVSCSREEGVNPSDSLFLQCLICDLACLLEEGASSLRLPSCNQQLRQFQIAHVCDDFDARRSGVVAYVREHRLDLLGGLSKVGARVAGSERDLGRLGSRRWRPSPPSPTGSPFRRATPVPRRVACGRDRPLQKRGAIFEVTVLTVMPS